MQTGIEEVIRGCATILIGKIPGSTVCCVGNDVPAVLEGKGINPRIIEEVDLPFLLNETAFSLYRFLRDNNPEQLYLEPIPSRQGMVSATIEINPDDINLRKYRDLTKNLLKKYQPQDLRIEIITIDGQRLDYWLNELSTDQPDIQSKLQRKLPLLINDAGVLELKVAIKFNINKRDVNMLSAELSRNGIAGYGTSHELVFVYVDMPH